MKNNHIVHKCICLTIMHICLLKIEFGKGLIVPEGFKQCVLVHKR